MVEDLFADLDKIPSAPRTPVNSEAPLAPPPQPPIPSAPAPPEKPRRLPILPAIIILVILIVVGGGYVAWSRDWISLPFLKKNSNTAVTTTNLNLNTNSTANQSAPNNSNSSSSEAALTDLARAACYVNRHPTVVDLMPKNELSESFRDYITADPQNLRCDVFTSEEIEAVALLITTDGDSDGLTLVTEQLLGTRDDAQDTNGDGKSDYDEFLNFDNALGLSPGAASGPDSDGDNISDELEEKLDKTDPKKADTDSDGLTDYEETSGYLTKALLPDSDNDTYNDGTEVCNGFNPLGSGTYTSPLPYPPAACPPGLTPPGTRRPEPSEKKSSMTITELAAVAADGVITVTWKTSEPANGVAYFGPTTAYTTGRYPDNYSLLTDHSISIPVTPGQLYHLAVLSCPQDILYLSDCPLSDDLAVTAR